MSRTSTTSGRYGNLGELLTLLLDRAYVRAIPPTRDASKFLAREMRREILAQSRALGRGRLHIPVFWAVYLHEGRAPGSRILPKNGPVLIYFKNPLVDDPRLRGGYPKRRTEVRRLPRGFTRSDEFKQMVRDGRAFVRRSVGRTENNEPRRFFGNAAGEGMAAFKAEADGLARDWATTEVIRALGKRQTVRTTVTL